MPPSDAHASIALVVAAYAGSQRAPGAGHAMLLSVIPDLLDRAAASSGLSYQAEIFVYLHCDLRTDNSTWLTAEHSREIKRRTAPVGPYAQFNWPATCHMQQSQQTAMRLCDGQQRAGLTCTVEYLANVGREAHVYLHHVVRVYSSASIADLTFFVQEGEVWGMNVLFACWAGLRHRRDCNLSDELSGRHVLQELSVASPLGTDPAEALAVMGPSWLKPGLLAMRACGVSPGVSSPRPRPKNASQHDIDDASSAAAAANVATGGSTEQLLYDMMARGIPRFCHTVDQMAHDSSHWSLGYRGVVVASVSALWLPR